MSHLYNPTIQIRKFNKPVVAPNSESLTIISEKSEQYYSATSKLKEGGLSQQYLTCFDQGYTDEDTHVSKEVSSIQLSSKKRKLTEIHYFGELPS